MNKKSYRLDSIDTQIYNFQDSFFETNLIQIFNLRISISFNDENTPIKLPNKQQISKLNFQRFISKIKQHHRYITDAILENAPTKLHPQKLEKGLQFLKKRNFKALF